jgi:hypothetical protein
MSASFNHNAYKAGVILKTPPKLKTSKLNSILWKLHLWLGLITFFGMLIWSLSGLLHPVMTWTQPKAINSTAPLYHISLAKAQPLFQTLKQNHIEQFTHFKIVNLNDNVAYRIQQSSSGIARYFNIETGKEIIDGDRDYAKQLALHYVGSNAVIKNIRFVTQFDSDYPEINRILPVWYIEFYQNDNLRVYIDTNQGNLITLSNNTKHMLSNLFETVHKWSFLNAMPNWQAVLMSIFLLCILFSALSGIYFYLIYAKYKVNKSKQTYSKRMHRQIGSILSILILMFSLSGLYHLWNTILRNQSNQEAHILNNLSTKFKLPIYKTNTLYGDTGWNVLIQKPVSELSLSKLENRPVWQVVFKADNITTIINTHGQVLLPNGTEIVAKQLAMHYANKLFTDIDNIEYIQEFNHDYGFIYKRLPVYKVTFNHGLDYYVQPSSGALSAKLSMADNLEATSFSYLHKWHFIPFKGLRNILYIVFTCFSVFVAILGCVLFVKKIKSKKYV